MELSSREYAKFKRLFVGPLMPRSIARQRRSENFHPKPKKAREFLVVGDERKLWDRAAMKRNATPNWADKNKIDLMYKECKRITLETGVKHHVDHIIPVRHPLVCGLHVENNLRIISADENMNKTNKFSITW